MTRFMVEKVADSAGYETALAIRRRVFVDEQGVPAELEVDSHEADATFFVAYEAAPAGRGHPAATGRFRRKGPLLKFERIATLPEFRGQGAGRAVMAAMTEAARRSHPGLVPYMHAQLSAAGFYDRLGWRRVGGVFEEAGIGHVAMYWPTPVAQSVLAAWLAHPELPEALRLRLRQEGMEA